jgi:hypothetical protein
MLEISQYLTSNYTTNHSNKNSMVLAQKQTHRPWDRIKEAEINPHSYSHLIFDKEPKNMLEKRRPLQ